MALYTIYKLTSPDGKVYVGKSKKSKSNIKSAWRYGSAFAQRPAVYAAIRKYEWGNMNKEIVMERVPDDEVEYRVNALIAQLHADDPEHGYNLGHKYKFDTDSGETVPLRGWDLKMEEGLPVPDVDGGFDDDDPATMYYVRCVETGGVYSSQSKLARALGVAKTTMSLAVNEGYACRGYTFEWANIHRKRDDAPEDARDTLNWRWDGDIRSEGDDN